MTGSREIRLAYGVDGLVVTVPATATVVRPLPAPAVADPAAALRDALRRPVAGAPLRDRVRPGQTVAIAICDPTRSHDS